MSDRDPKKPGTVAVIVPTLNELTGMEWFMPQLKKEWFDELIVIDGGSTDGTVEYCRKNGWRVVVQSAPGLAAALDEAFAKTSGDIVVTLSPDGNSVPALLPRLVDKMREGYDMVIASRYLGPAKSEDDDVLTGFGNWMFTSMVNLLFKTHYTDTLVIYRAFRRSAVEAMRLTQQEADSPIKRYFPLLKDWDMASSIRAAKLGLKVAEIPGDEPKRIGGERKLSIIRNGTSVLFQIFHEKFLSRMSLPGFAWAAA